MYDECQSGNAKCSQGCVDTYDSYYCTCWKGYRLETINYADQKRNCPKSLSFSSLQSDVVFLVDSSISICFSNSKCITYIQVLSFINQIVDGLNVNNRLTRIGMAIYSQFVSSRFFLNAYISGNSLSQIKGQITQAQYQAGSTSNLAAAIKSARENFFTASKGDRHGVQNFLIVLTNGASNVPAAVAEAKLAYQDGIIVLAIGLTSRATLVELQQITTFPLAPNPSFFRSGGASDYAFLSQALSSRILKSSALSNCANQVMDMVILMDEQVPQTQWNICLNFLVRLVEGLNVASGKTYVAFVLYNRNGARVVINLNRFSNNKAALIAAIRGTRTTQNSRSASNMARGIQTARSGVFASQTSGARPDVHRVLIIIAENQLTGPPSEAIAASDLLKATGVTVYAYSSLSSGIPLMDLKMISSHPRLEYRQWLFRGFSEQWEDLILGEVCKAKYEHFCRPTFHGGYQCFCPLNKCDVIPVNGTKCHDVNECQMNNGGCQQTCSNTQGAYACGCNTGFTLSKDRKSCEDIDECLGRINPCSTATTCLNSYGSYYCIRRESIANQQSNFSRLSIKGNHMDKSVVIGLTSFFSVLVTLMLVLLVVLLLRFCKGKQNKASEGFSNYGASMKGGSVVGSLRSGTVSFADDNVIRSLPE